MPVRRARLEAGAADALRAVPVGLTFFVKSAGGVMAHYPSPMGATRWDLPADTSEALERRHPQLGGMEPDVEALLVNTARGARHEWIVPIDDCCRLIAVVRRSWRGLSGGSEVWSLVERFFAELTESPGANG